jgi:tellurite resistance protein
VVDDADLAMSLQGLGLGRDNYRAVVLLPLIEVAWSDGRIQRAERRRIAQIARRYGIEPSSEWLDRWLKRRPSKKAFFAARTVLLALMARAGKSDVPVESVEQVLDLCLWVAEAAGGLFGLAFTVSRTERDCIEQIAASLALGPALPEGVVSAWHEARRRQNLAEAPTAHRKRTRYGILDQTTAHLDIWGKRTQSLNDLADPLESTDSEITTGTFDQRTVARIAVPVPSPDDTGAMPAVGARGVADLVGEAFAAADDLPTSESIPRPEVRAAAEEPLDSNFEVETPQHRPGPAATTYEEGAAAPEPSEGARDAARQPASEPAFDLPERPPPPVPLGLRSITPSAGSNLTGPSLPEPAAARPRRRRVAQVGRGEALAEEDPTLPFFDDVNVGTYNHDVEPEDG